MGTWLPSVFVTATLLAGCSASSAKTEDAGPTYCAQSVGSVDSCQATAATGPVEQCGSESPVCTPPGQAGGGVWSCCTSTILGDGVREFNNRWGVRGMARGAVVVILSDGWDRGDPDELAEQMARLHRVAHRVVWVNPLKAAPGYAPLPSHGRAVRSRGPL